MCDSAKNLFFLENKIAFHDGDADSGSGQHVQLNASFTANKATGHGTLTVSATIERDWHIYSLTQPVGGPGKSELKVTKSPDFNQKANSG